MFETPHETYSFGEFTLDVSSHLFLRGQHEIKLTAQPFKALLYLVRKPNTLIKKNDLIDAVRGKDVNLTPDAAKKWIDHIRAALGDQDQIIETVHGEGWRFNADVQANSPAVRAHSDTQTAAGDIPGTRAPAQPANAGSTPARQVAEDDSKRAHDGTETFEGWIGGRGWVVTLTLVVCVMVTVVISIAVFVRWQHPNSAVAAKIAASGAQCLVILIAYVSSWRWNRGRGFGSREQYSEKDVEAAGFENIADFENDRSNLEGALRQYTKYWRWLLLSWVPLYLLFTIEGWIGQTATVLEIIFNILNTAMIFLCFNVLNKDLDDEDNEHLTGSALIALVLIMVVGVLVLTIVTENLKGATLLTGIAAGVIMALYVGRLQSKFLGPRPWLLILLYSYTAIQPLVLYIKDEPIWAVIVLDFALILKCLLYLYMTWLFQSGLLLFYFARMKRTYGTVREQRQAFRKLLA